VRWRGPRTLADAWGAAALRPDAAGAAPWPAFVERCLEVDGSKDEDIHKGSKGAEADRRALALFLAGDLDAQGRCAVRTPPPPLPAVPPPTHPPPGGVSGFTLYTLHFALYTLHFALCTLHFALCTLTQTLARQVSALVDALTGVMPLSEAERFGARCVPNGSKDAGAAARWPAVRAAVAATLADARRAAAAGAAAGAGAEEGEAEAEAEAELFSRLRAAAVRLRARQARERGRGGSGTPRGGTPARAAEAGAAATPVREVGTPGRAAEAGAAATPVREVWTPWRERVRTPLTPARTARRMLPEGAEEEELAPGLPRLPPRDPAARALQFPAAGAEDSLPGAADGARAADDAADDAAAETPRAGPRLDITPHATPHATPAKGGGGGTPRRGAGSAASTPARGGGGGGQPRGDAHLDTTPGRTSGQS
jgi:hypothetical protein